MSEPDISDLDAEFEGRDFAPAERARLRRQMREFERYRFAWHLAGRVMTWSVFVIGTLWAGREVISRVVRAVFGEQR